MLTGPVQLLLLEGGLDCQASDSQWARKEDNRVILKSWEMMEA